MIETICPNCGNLKSFEDVHQGKTFKCPNCSNPVTISNIGSQFQTDPISKANNFAEEIAQAEREKKLKEEEDMRMALIEANQKKIKNYLYYGIAAGFCGIAWVSDGEYLGLGLLSIGLSIWLFYQRNKLQKGEA